MAAATGSKFMLEEVGFFLWRVLLLEKREDASPSTGEAAAMVNKVCIHLIFRDERRMGRELGHRLGNQLAVQRKLPEPLPYNIQLVIMKAEKAAVIGMGFIEAFIVRYDHVQLFRLAQGVGQTALFLREPAALHGQHGGEVADIPGLLRQIPMKHQQGVGDLAALVSGGLGQLYSGGKLSLLIQLLHTGRRGLPRDDLRGGYISGRGAFCDVDAVLCIPRRVLDAARLNAIPTVEFPGEVFRELGNVFALGNLCNQVHPAVLGIAAISKELVDDLLGDGKSEGRRCDALRFLNDMDLFFF